MVMDRRRSADDPYSTSPDVTEVGDWVFMVATFQLTGNIYRGGVTPRDLAAIRLPGLMARALKPVVSVVADDGSLTFGPTDPDERARLAYFIAQLVGENPTQAVAAELGVSSNAAAQRVFRLRRDGRLPRCAEEEKGQAP